LGNVTRLLTSLVLIILTFSFRLTGFEEDIHEDLWQPGANYDYSSPAPSDRINYEDNDLDEDGDTQFVNEEPKLYTAVNFIKKQTGTNADLFFKAFDRPLMDTRRETPVELIESPAGSTLFAPLYLRAPPSGSV